LPLVAASAAQAALTGANRLVTTSRPDLVSASITGANSAQFCFDKTITSVPNIGGFFLGGYRADVTTSSTGATASGQCVNATVSTSQQFSFAQVGEDAVRTTGSFGNRADSVALSGSTTQNGTRGLSVAPDLSGISVVTVSGAPQQIAFTFDEPVSSSAIVGTGAFHFVVSSGTQFCPIGNAACDVPSDSATISATDPNTVIAQFPVGGTPLVTNAVRGYTLPGAVVSATDAVPSGYQSAHGPGSSGFVTGVPTLVSAQYSRQPGTTGTCGTTGQTNCVVVDYVFNEGVSVNNNAATLTNFFAYLSDGSFVNPTSVTEPSGTNGGGGLFSGSTTVRAFYGGTSDASAFDEYFVKAAVAGATTTGNLNTLAAPLLSGCSATQQASLTDTCAVTSTTTGQPNTPGGAPIGGNTGGFAAGFTTAPDAFGTAFDTLTNTASVTFDSRIFASGIPGSGALTTQAANYQLLDGNGNEIAPATNVVMCSPSTSGFPTAAGCALPTGTPTTTSGGTTTVWLTFPSPAVQVGNAKALEIRGQLGGSEPFGFAALGGNLFDTQTPGSITGGSYGNLEQIVSPSAVAASTHLRAGHHWSHKKMTRKLLRKVLAQTKHHAKKHSKKK
jgi:hypothetical protein